MKLTCHAKSVLQNRVAHYATVATPYGSALIAVSDGHLCWLNFPQSGGGLTALEDYWRGGTLLPANQDLQVLADDIFAGRHANISIMVAGTAFQHTVWQGLAEVAHGETISYGELARRIGRPTAARPVGGALGANPVAYLLPCHRVLSSTGALHGFGCGLPLKERLLNAEGIRRAA